MGMLQQLMQMLQSLMGYGGRAAPYGGSGSCPPYGGNGSCAPHGGERFFQNATARVEGDPHLSFNGSALEQHGFAARSAQLQLVCRRISNFDAESRRRTAAASTWNQSATVSLNDGATNVSMNNDGQRRSRVLRPTTVDLAPGQTLQLGNGESVTYDQNGSLASTRRTRRAAASRRPSPRGEGVNVDVTAHDVDLGGALVNGTQAQPGPVRDPMPARLPDRSPTRSGTLAGPDPATNPRADYQSWPGPIADPYALPNANF